MNLTEATTIGETPVENFGRESITTDEGQVELPILYYDFSQVSCFFTVDPKRLEPLLKNTDLKPAVLINGQAAVILVFFEYRSTSIGPYNEVGLCSFTYSTKLPKPTFHLPDLFQSGEKWKSAAYVHHLPVSTAIANAAGRKVWGYPKFVADIPFELDDRSFNGSVTDPKTNEPIFTLQGKRGFIGPGFKMPPMDIVTYTNHENQQLRTHISTYGQAFYNLFPGMELHIGLSDHPMAQDLRRLDLDCAKPIMVSTAYNAQSVLPKGIPVA